jgi:hypothetical protein
MSKIKPKVVLNELLLYKAMNYYKIRMTDEQMQSLKGLNCFSDPSLELHECNSRSLLPGDRPCDFCKNNIDRPCDIACDFQNFCLAVYAWRLGLGGDNFNSALQGHLYKMTPDQLHEKVVEILADKPVHTKYSRKKKSE